MSQIVVAQSSHGIILAAENRVLQLNEKGEEVSLPLNRLLPLSSHCALVAVGAAEGAAMGESLKTFLQGEGKGDVQDLYGAALSFLSTEYDDHMKKQCELMPVDPIHQVSFILAGKTAGDPERPFRLYYIWNKKKLPRLDGDEISQAFCLPRRMGLEYQLNQLGKEDAPLEALLAKAREGVAKLKAQGEAGDAFSWAKITLQGYQAL